VVFIASPQGGVHPAVGGHKHPGYENGDERRGEPALRKGQVGIWQKRFWEHLIRDERDYRNHMEYCWGNPVKHGFVERVVDWPFSSIHREIARGTVSPEWGGLGQKCTA